MKNTLLQKIATPFIALGMATASMACATFPSNSGRTVYLDNGYTVASLGAEKELEFAAAIYLGKIRIKKTGDEYIAEGNYTKSGKEWNSELNNVCKNADKTKDKFISESEARDELISANNYLVASQ